MLKFILAIVSLLALTDTLSGEPSHTAVEFDVEKFVAMKFSDTDPSVGLLGDTTKIKFSGQQQLSPEILRKALAFDLEYQSAARPSASLATFLETLQERLQQGLLHSGFLQGTAKATFDAKANAVHVQITEGPRYKNAGLQITRTKKIDAELLERTLLAPVIPSLWKYQFDEIALDLPREFDSSTSDWELGKIISADSKTLLELKQRVLKALLNQGYPHAKFKIDVVPTDQQTAEFVITFEEEGPKGVIEDIAVKGLDRHSEDQILKYFELSHGMPVNAEVLDSLHEKLRNSCRFWKYQVAVRVFDSKRDRYSTTPRGLLLSITLSEYHSVQPLGKPLSETEEVMKRCANWLENYTQQQSTDMGDLVIEKHQTQISNDWMDCGFRLIISPNQGTLFHATFPTSWAIHHSFLFSRGELCLFSHNKSEKWTLASHSFVPTVSIKCLPGDLEDHEYQNSLKLGYGMKQDRSNTQPTIKWEIECEPVAMINLLYRHGAKHEFQGDELCIASRGIKFRIDRNTGELRQVSLTSPDISPQEWGSITFRKNAFMTENNGLHTKTSKFAERYNPKLPLTSFTQFALDQLLAQPFVKEIDTWRIPLQTTRNATKTGFLDAMLSDFLTISPFSVSRNNSFILPKMESGDADDDDFSQFIVHLMPFLADYLFPHGSWPWTLTRELGFCYRSGPEVGSTEKRARELHRITRNEHTGVLGNLITLLFAKTFLAKIPAEQIMTMKKRDVNEAAFLQDVRLLVKGDTGSALVAHKLVDTLSNLPESDLAALGDDLPTSWHTALTALKQRRETHPNETPAESIETVAAIYWNSGLGEYVNSLYNGTASDVSATAEIDKSSRR